MCVSKSEREFGDAETYYTMSPEAINWSSDKAVPQPRLPEMKEYKDQYEELINQICAFLICDLHSTLTDYTSLNTQHCFLNELHKIIKAKRGRERQEIKVEHSNWQTLWAGEEQNAMATNESHNF